MKKRKEDRYSVSPYSIRSDKSQRVFYQNPDFPASLQRISFPENIPFLVSDHWHDELEFIYVKEGQINYNVEGENLILKEGQGLFVNSRKLHVISENEGHTAKFYCVILHPLLLCASSYVDEKYVEPIIKNTCISYVLLDSKDEWAHKILDMIEKIYLCVKENMGMEKDIAPLRVQMYFFNIWQILYSNVEIFEKNTQRTGHNLSILKEMISFIYQHYGEKISLDDIAYAGNVGKTKCISIFNKYINKTPGEFLKGYRIQQSAKLLSTTDMSITEICYETGFTSASYFGRTFKEFYNYTPLEYRNQQGNGV